VLLLMRILGGVLCNSVDVKEQVYHRIRDNRRISVDKTTCEVSVSRGKKRYNYGLLSNRKKSSNQENWELLDHENKKYEIKYKHKKSLTTVSLPELIIKSRLIFDLNS
jgi:hypothetical protein